MAKAAHPQRDAAELEQAGVHEPEPAPDDAVAKNPFPSTMVVPGLDGEEIVVELAVVDGMLYAPRLDDMLITPTVRQYVVQYCSAWSASVLLAGRLNAAWSPPPRRAQVWVPESQLHTMLGLAADERLLRVAYDDVAGGVRFIVESPRLPMQPFWDGGPAVISLPIASAYEQPGTVQ